MSDQRRDFVFLSGPWASHSDEFREDVARRAARIHTSDGGYLELANGRWEVFDSGDHHEADLVMNSLHKPN